MLRRDNLHESIRQVARPTIEIEETVLVDLIGVLDDEALDKLTESSRDALAELVSFRAMRQSGGAGGKLHQMHQKKRLAASTAPSRSSTSRPGGSYSPATGTTTAPRFAVREERRRFDLLALLESLSDEARERLIRKLQS